MFVVVFAVAMFACLSLCGSVVADVGVGCMAWLWVGWLGVGCWFCGLFRVACFVIL